MLNACSSVAPQYFTLGTPELSSLASQPKPITSLGVARIRLPSLLDRQGMVLRKDNFSVEVSEQYQWAGVLREEFNESLVSGLQSALPSSRSSMTRFFMASASLASRLASSSWSR